MNLIANIVAGILIFFGVLFIWGAFSDEGQVSWIFVGMASAGIGFAIIWFTRRQSGVEASERKVTYDIELSGDIELEKFQCRNCGGPFSNKDVSIMAGAATLTCPYCGSIYQLSEKPKW